MQFGFLNPRPIESEKKEKILSPSSWAHRHVIGNRHTLPGWALWQVSAQILYPHPKGGRRGAMTPARRPVWSGRFRNSHASMSAPRQAPEAAGDTRGVAGLRAGQLSSTTLPEHHQERMLQRAREMAGAM